MARDGDMPRALLERPTLRPELRFTWAAFWRLTHDRQMGFGSVGRIPFAAIDRYATRYGIAESEAFDRFAALIAAMDDVYLEWASERSSQTDTDRHV